ncbi:transposase [Siccirubricoccus sp. G192]|nr:transposase [Siccirubricoccus sp. G192]
MVRETLEPGVVVQTVADRHGVSAGQFYTWRKQMVATAISGFVPEGVHRDSICRCPRGRVAWYLRGSKVGVRCSPPGWTKSKTRCTQTLRSASETAWTR